MNAILPLRNGGRYSLKAIVSLPELPVHYSEWNLFVRSVYTEREDGRRVQPVKTVPYCAFLCRLELGGGTSSGTLLSSTRLSTVEILLFSSL